MQTLDQLAQELRQKLPPNTPMYLLWGRTPEELWNSLVAMGGETGLPSSLLAQVGKVLAEEGYNILALSWDGKRLHVVGTRAQVVVPVRS